MSANTLHESTDFPRTWSFDDDGERLEGTFVELGEAPTANGYKPICTVEVKGESRTLWLFHEALASRFRDELEQRREPNFRVGERIIVERGDWKESASGRRYRSYRVRFPDRPRRSARDILGAAASEETSDDDDLNENEDDIPF